MSKILENLHNITICVIKTPETAKNLTGMRGLLNFGLKRCLYQLNTEKLCQPSVL